MHWSHDIAATVRGLRRSPGFVLVAVGTLSIAMAANTTIFSIINAVGRPELPYRDPQRILSISEAYRPYGWTDVPTSLATLVDLRRETSTFSSIAAHSQRRVSYADGERAPQRLHAAVVSANLWTTLGVAPVLGRGFADEDDRRGAAHPIVIGYRLWRDRYGLDRDVLRRSAIVDGVLHRIIGVMPEGFRFPEAEDLWLPVGIILEREPRALELRDARAWHIAARLQSGATLAQARTELERLAARSADQHPQTNRGWTLSAVPITRESLVATSSFFGALQAGALLLTLVMCGNLGNLLLARGEQRRRELAVRAALGASRRTLIWLLLLEAVLLALTAAGVALLLARWAIGLVPLAIPETIPFYIRFRIDGVVAAFTIVIALMTAIAAGLGSVFRAPKGNPARVLSAGATTLVGATGAGRLRSTFLFVQTAVSAALLASTLVIASGLLHFHRMDLGFDPANTLLVEVPLPPATPEPPDTSRVFAGRVLDRLRRLPDVRAAAVSSPLPLATPADGVAIESASRRENEPPGSYSSVTPDFFTAAGIRILRGRGFTSEDVSGAEQVVVLNLEAAARLFGGSDPLGQRIRFGRAVDARPWRTVVGIVPNVIVQPLDPEIEPRLYVPFDQDPGRLLTLTVRTAGEPELLGRSVSAALAEVDPNVAHDPPISVRRQLSIALWPLRFFNAFAAGLALFGVLVAAAGVYGLTRYLTLACTKEIGLRLALGATPGAIVRLLATASGFAVGGGILAGLCASIAISSLLQHLLAGVSAFNPAALAVAGCCLSAAGGLALGGPALRATRIQPAEALRRD